MTYHTSINWVNIKSIWYKTYPIENQFPHLGKWFRTLTIQPHNWADDGNDTPLAVGDPELREQMCRKRRQTHLGARWRLLAIVCSTGSTNAPLTVTQEKNCIPICSYSRQLSFSAINWLYKWRNRQTLYPTVSPQTAHLGQNVECAVTGVPNPTQSKATWHVM